MGNFWSYRAHKARLFTSNVRFVINRSFSIFLSAIIERVQWSTYLAQINVYITDIVVNDSRKSAFFLF